MESPTLSLADLTVDDFSARLSDAFTVKGHNASLQLVLSGIEKFGMSQRRQAFSLRFMGPAQPVLPQSIYRLENATMGVMDIFLVPLGPQDGGMRYEAVFT